VLDFPARDARALDVICLGRAGVDLYAQQADTDLREVTSFAKHVGGCAANIAVGCARLGLRTGVISRIGWRTPAVKSTMHAWPKSRLSSSSPWYCTE